MTLAIFDLDNTLLSGDSDHSWGSYLVEICAVDSAAYAGANDKFYAQYQEGSLDINEFLAFSLKPLADNSIETLTAWHKDFMQKKVMPMIGEKAKALIQKHKQAGHTLMVITATNTFVTGPIVEYLGIAHLLGTDPEMVDGEYTGNVVGIPTFQDGKVIRLNQWLDGSKECLSGSFFYSDSINDLPLLQIVDHPVAVDPDSKLEAYANEHGWEVISLSSL